MMDSIIDFKKSLEGLKPSTLRVYVAGAKTAINAVKANVSECRSYGELLTLILEAQPEKRARVAPFLRFLQRGARGANTSVPREDVRGIQFLVIQTLCSKAQGLPQASIYSKLERGVVLDYRANGFR